ncbi:MAG: calcium-binding protein [Pseudomonadota bacterium]
MITFDASNLTTTFSGASVGNFLSYVTHDATSYTWQTSNGHSVTLVGTGLTVSGSNILNGGTVTSVQIDLGNDSPLAPDIVISGFSFDMASVSFSTRFGSGAELWNFVLAGEISTYIPPATGISLNMFGDFISNGTSSIRAASDDVLVGNGAGLISGDGGTISGGQVVAGYDRITGDLKSAYGDVTGMSGDGLLVGGNDTITVDGGTVVTAVRLYGDTGSVGNTAVVFGGDDLLNLNGAAGFNNFASGDATLVLLEALLVAGDDTIRGSAGNDSLYGDAEGIAGTFKAGNDEIRGGNGNDVIVGDYAQALSTAVIARTGNDLLDGQAGNDTITAQGGNDTLIGGTGNDSLLGEDGDDAIRGDDGQDIMDGGAGRDTLNGGNGNDRMDGGAENDTMNGGDGLDRMLGGDGLDLLSGGAGNDNIVGGAGRDTINGGTDDDRLAGNQGADIFVFNGAFGNDTIRDFNINRDEEKIDLSAVAAITDFTDLMDNHVDDSSGLVVISDGLGNSITLERITDDTLLEAGDFLF